MDERESRRGDPEEEGSTRALRASAGYRATDERDQARMDIYLPLQADGCVHCAVLCRAWHAAPCCGCQVARQGLTGGRQMHAALAGSPTLLCSAAQRCCCLGEVRCLPACPTLPACCSATPLLQHAAAQRGAARQWPGVLVGHPHQGGAREAGGG